MQIWHKITNCYLSRFLQMAECLKIFISFIFSLSLNEICNFRTINSLKKRRITTIFPFSKSFLPCSGYTLLETMLAFLLIYLASVYLLGLYAAGTEYATRNKEYSTTTYLARAKMEQLQVVPWELIKENEGSFDKPYEDYNWNLKVDNYTSNTKLLELIVTSPAKAKTHLRTLRPVHRFYGVSHDKYVNQICYSQPETIDILMRDDTFYRTCSYDSPPADFKQSSEYWQPGDYFGHPAGGFLWVANQLTPHIAYYVFDQNNNIQSSKLASPTLAYGVSTPYFVGITGDSMGNRLYCADRANRGVWILEDKNPQGLKWLSSKPFSPMDIPLGRPSGIASDDNSSILWLADGENSCLRKLYLNLDIAPKDCENEPGVGYWSKPVVPPGSPGVLQGVAVNTWSSIVYTVDQSSLYCLSYQKQNGINQEVWSKIPLPEELSKDLPSGISCDSFNNRIYINTLSGRVWNYSTMGNGSFTDLAWQ